MSKKQVQKLSVFAFALSLGIVWSACTLLAGWFASLGWGAAYVHILSSIYIGYGPSFFGSVIGAIWAFFDALVGGLVFAYLYNIISPRLKV